jgi:hypothetical protein
MAATTTRARARSGPRLSDEDLATIVRLAREADSVELKLSIPESDKWATARALDLDPLDAQIRQVFFFDTPDLALDRAGLVVRARRVQGRADDSTVKLRPIEPESLRKQDRRSPNLVVEVDAMPTGYVCSASMKCGRLPTDVRAVVQEDAPVRKLFSKEQRRFYEAHAPQGLALDDLAVLGPITVFKLKTAPPDLGRKAVVELWQYPDRSQVIEISTRAKPADAKRAADEARAFLAARGIEVSPDQQTKTRTALEYFSGQSRGA